MQPEALPYKIATAPSGRPSLRRTILIAVLVAPPLTAFLLFGLAGLVEFIRRGTPAENLLVPLAILHPIGLFFAYLFGAVPALVGALLTFRVGRYFDKRGRIVAGTAIGFAVCIAGILVVSVLIGRQLLGDLDLALEIVAAAALAAWLCAWWIESGPRDQRPRR